MAVKKLSVALDESVAAAAERALVVEAGLDAVRSWEAEHGELTAEELAWAAAGLDAGGTPAEADRRVG